jgi:chromosome segregation ATPase
MPRRTAERAAPPPADPDRRRDKLRAAIAERHEEEARLAALEEAQTRAHQQRQQAQSKLWDAERSLQEATRDAPQRKAYAFLNDDAPDVDPVADAQAAVAGAQAEATRLAEAETALSDEITRVQFSLRMLRAAQYAALADVLAASAEYQALAEQHSAAWQRLRSVRAALDAVVAGCHAQYPKKLEDEPRRVEPLAADRVGYPAD